jgi:hypothetical protein
MSCRELYRRLWEEIQSYADATAHESSTAHLCTVHHDEKACKESFTMREILESTRRTGRELIDELIKRGCWKQIIWRET